MKNINILDNMFSHANSTSPISNPLNFTWIREHNQNLMIFSDSHVFHSKNYNTNKKIAWLIESPLVTENSYNYVLKNYTDFYKIFTFDEKILNNTSNSEFLPIGGCWIVPEDRKIYKKTKNISIISSEKNYLPGHKLRHEIISSLKNIDVYGRKYNPIKNKIYGLMDYKFSICIENVKKNFYFTEKLIDCFITGTIPIYWGCPSIGNFFDEKGIIVFDNLQELETIINNIDNEYEKRYTSVLHNFEIAKKYVLADDIIYEKLKNLL